jgi:hypothetical protein
LPQALHRPAPVDTTSEAHRHAYNAAFQELDLPWHWDERTFARLQPSGRAGVRAWVEQEQPHLLRAYAPDFLVDAIEDTKARCHRRIVHAVAVPAARLAA